MSIGLGLVTARIYFQWKRMCKLGYKCNQCDCLQWSLICHNFKQRWYHFIVWFTFNFLIVFTDGVRNVFCKVPPGFCNLRIRECYKLIAFSWGVSISVPWNLVLQSRQLKHKILRFSIFTQDTIPLHTIFKRRLAGLNLEIFLSKTNHHIKSPV